MMNSNLSLVLLLLGMTYCYCARAGVRTVVYA